MRRIPSFLITLALSLGLATGAAARGEPQVSLDDMRTLADVFGYIKSYYVEDVDDSDLLQAAIRGMLSELDPHTAYLSREELHGLEEQVSGHYGGLGVEIHNRQDFLEVVSALDNTPAARAGLRAGDRIIAIDHQPLSPDNAIDSVNRLRGEPGTQVELTVERDHEPAPLEFTVMREVIRVDSVSARPLPGGYGYVRLSSFQYDTAASLDDAVGELMNREAPLHGLVLDLRGNPGGVLSAAVSVADRFLDEGLIVYTEGRGHGERLEFPAHPGDITDGLPIVVLVDRGSASAAEIVAGALQAHERALILGERTFGKGSVQTVMHLRNGSGMRLTTALYFTPDGRAIQAEGIEPDVPLGTYRRVAEQDSRRRESELERHLPGHGLAGVAPDDEALDEDHAINEALHLLKGARLLSRNARSD